MAEAKRAPLKPWLLAAAGLAALNDLPAHAATQTLGPETFDQLQSLSASGNGGSDSDSFSDFVTFDKFDPSLGTLTQVQIELVSRVSGFVQVSGSGSGNVSAELDIDLSVDVDGVLSLFSPGFSANPSANCLADPSCSSSPSFSSPFNGNELITGSNLGLLFTATVPGETFNVNLLGTLNLQLACDSNVESCSSSAFARWFGTTFVGAGGGVTVTYTYEEPAAVPGPASLVLLGLGLAGLGLRQRRRGGKLWPRAPSHVTSTADEAPSAQASSGR